MTNQELYRKAIGVLGWQSQIENVLEKSANLTIAIQNYKKKNCGANILTVVEALVEIEIATEINKEIFAEDTLFEKIKQKSLQKLEFEINRKEKLLNHGK